MVHTITGKFGGLKSNGYDCNFAKFGILFLNSVVLYYIASKLTSMIKSFRSNLIAKALEMNAKN